MGNDCCEAKDSKKYEIKTSEYDYKEKRNKTMSSLKKKYYSIELIGIDNFENECEKVIPDFFEEIVKNELFELKKIEEEETNKNNQIFLLKLETFDHCFFVYHGSINELGFLEGYGRMYLIDKNIYYEGGFKNNKFHGKGFLVSNKGDYYIGDWNEGSVKGEGRIQYYQGIVFQGKFNDFKKNGEGTEINSRWIYNGNYVDNHKQGKGRCEFISNIEPINTDIINTNNYINTTNEDIQETKYILTNEYFLTKSLKKIKLDENQFTYNYDDFKINLIEYYEGEFDKDNMNGIGKFVSWDEAIYKGSFKNGKIEGKGEIKYKDNSIFEGLFKNNKKEGKGIYKWNDLEILYGFWKNDLLEGVVILDLNNNRYFLEYRHSKLIRKNLENNLSNDSLIY